MRFLSGDFLKSPLKNGVNFFSAAGVVAGAEGTAEAAAGILTHFYGGFQLVNINQILQP